MIICTLKSSEPDLILPLSSFTSRMLPAGQTSTISIIVANGIAFADAIALRLSGYLEIAFNGVVFAYSDSITSNQLFEGATSTSTQLTAEGEFPTLVPGNIDLEGVSFQAINVNGDVRLRAKFNPNIIPGSTVNYDGEAHEVDQITVTESVGSYTMEIFANA